jgi:hypothetical protein
MRTRLRLLPLALIAACAAEEHGSSSGGAPSNAVEHATGHARLVLASVRDRGLLRGSARPAAETFVTRLAERADRPFAVVDRESGLGLEATLVGARPVAAAAIDGDLVFLEAGPDAGGAPGHVVGHAPPGPGTIVQRSTGRGIEDHVLLPRADRTRLDWRVTFSNEVAGLRLVGGVLEFVDRSGTPRLRVERPVVVDERGTARQAALEVEGCAYDDDPAPPWGRTPIDPGARTCRVAVRWSNEGLVGSIVVDPSWASAGEITEHSGHTATRLVGGPQDGKVVVVGGGYGPGNGELQPLPACDLFDPKTRTWASCGSLVIARLDHAGAAIRNGGVFVAGGVTGTPNVETATAETFDPATGRWTRVTAAMNRAPRYHTATTLANGDVLIAGGIGTGASANISQVWSPTTRLFTATSAFDAFAKEHWSHAAVRFTAGPLVGKVLLAGGRGGSATASEIYDPATRNWRQTGKRGPDDDQMIAWRSQLGLVELEGGKVLAVGGSSNIETWKTAEIFDPVAETWTEIQSSMSVARSGLTATALPTGRILVAGGGVDTSELFDPPSGKFLPGSVETMVFGPRRGHAATLLADGRVLVTGGRSAANDVRGTELYDRGAACTAGTECASGQCIDGVCCVKACGQCEACDVGAEKGTCVPIAGAPRAGRPACTGTGGPCGGTCDGTTGASCSYPPTTTACGGRCEAGRRTPRTCDGAGTCVDGTAASCSGFACQDAETCRTTCTSDPDCASGYLCQGGACVPAEARCNDDRTASILSTTGAVRECAPFRCNPVDGRCLATCVTTDDCALGRACNAGACVDVPQSDDGGGCGVAGGRSPRGIAGLFALFAIAIGCAQRRTSRR